MTATFERVLVAYDGSEPAERALEFAISFGRAGSAVDVVNVVDGIDAIVHGRTIVGGMASMTVMDEPSRRGRVLLEAAAVRCRSASVAAETELLHERVVPGIAAAAERHGDDLVVLGMHARDGIVRVLVGSTTEGVLRTCPVPVLAVTAAMTPPQGGPFRKLLVAVDGSDPSDGALELAAKFSRSAQSECVLCNVIDTRDLYTKAVTYGYDPEQFAEPLRVRSDDVLEHARLHGGFRIHSATTAIVEGEPGREIINEAARAGADAIVIGSHGRHGLQRLVLGSVAEFVVRHSPVPVFVVRADRRQ